MRTQFGDTPPVGLIRQCRGTRWLTHFSRTQDPDGSRNSSASAQPLCRRNPYLLTSSASSTERSQFLMAVAPTQMPRITRLSSGMRGVAGYIQCVTESKKRQLAVMSTQQFSTWLRCAPCRSRRRPKGGPNPAVGAWICDRRESRPSKRTAEVRWSSKLRIAANPPPPFDRSAQQV